MTKALAARAAAEDHKQQGTSAVSPAIASILGLVIMFIVGTALPINMGALAFALAFLIGTFFVNMSANAILAGFPGDLFVTLVGITYLFAIAQKNGTIDLLVHWAVRMVGGRVVAIPWVMFGVAAVLTAVGAVSPAAVAIIAPIALRFARHYRIDPLMMGLLVVHGAQGGGFSPSRSMAASPIRSWTAPAFRATRRCCSWPA
ncbi:SLC13 family permease [Pseudoroseomonas wenyumeiae]